MIVLLLQRVQVLPGLRRVMTAGEEMKSHSEILDSRTCLLNPTMRRLILLKLIDIVMILGQVKQCLQHQYQGDGEAGGRQDHCKERQEL